VQAQAVTFGTTGQAGTVSAQLRLPKLSKRLVVFGHGAGAGMLHPNIQGIAEALAAQNVATLIFNFPFTEAGRKRVDGQKISVATIASAVAAAERLAPGLPIILGGHSYGGRMASHAVLERDLSQVKALVYCSFPLHPAGKPAIVRAAHLAAIRQPMLFLSGNRDKLAEVELLQSVVDNLGKQARLHWLDAADHGYNVLKRARKQKIDVFSEIAQMTTDFCNRL